MGLLIALLLLPFIIGLVGLFGYFFGVLIVKVPLMADILSGSILSEGDVPTVMAWVFILAVVVSVYAPRNDSK
jgi:uncharacterized membrane protein (DUF441 family)